MMRFEGEYEAYANNIEETTDNSSIYNEERMFREFNTHRKHGQLRKESIILFKLMMRQLVQCAKLKKRM